ncbi:hypothetical protein [Chitinophaga nivalis]|uniref:Uncharacterized protein n=1 Tax=Chitinophaga nivalis TaxID=2991709 RepID=A0ABT3IGM4_9BACT|nr:hypothetical protein [Chitinophaga nivalis]MCW3467204.1 hypothetical protein [Chitinophaga nivalis]MCW3483104.1 hypothetical protein [Chitinophaga nivalis]
MGKKNRLTSISILLVMFYFSCQKEALQEPKTKVPQTPVNMVPGIEFKSISDKHEDPTLLKFIHHYQESKTFRDKLNAKAIFHSNSAQ